MKKLLGPMLGACLAASIPAGAAAQPVAGTPSDTQAELVEARAIIDIMLPPANRQQTFDAMMASLTAQYRQGLSADPPSDPGVKAIIDEFLDKLPEAQKPLLHKHIPAMMDAMALAYSNEFTLAELKDVRAFASTPSGRHYLSRSLALVSDPAVAKVNSALIADAQRLMLTMREELKAKLVAYYNEHPEAVARPEPEAN